jgi:hypothetical protein
LETQRGQPQPKIKPLTLITLRLTQDAKKVLPQLAREAYKNDQLFFDKLNQRDQELLLRLVKEVIRKNDLRLSSLD